MAFLEELCGLSGIVIIFFLNEYRIIKEFLSWIKSLCGAVVVCLFACMSVVFVSFLSLYFVVIFFMSNGEW